jgi:hypothetical protein
MISLVPRRLNYAVLGGFLIGSSLVGYAQDETTPGIVRITDAGPADVPVQNVGYSAPGPYMDAYGLYGDCPDCYGGYGGAGKCPHCWGRGCYGKPHPHLAALFHPHYCCTAPGAGFSIPGKRPIYRRSAQYTNYFPAIWYGSPSANPYAGAPVFPMVYQPTDTTQLGFYYQHVPFWMPNPGALPPRPVPAQWHNYGAVVNPPWCGWLGSSTVGHRMRRHGMRKGAYAGGMYGPAYGPPGDGWVEVAPGAAPTMIPANPEPETGGEVVPDAPPVEDGAPPANPDPDKNNSASADPILRAVLEK